MKDVNLFMLPVLLMLADESMYWKKPAVFPSQMRILKEIEEKFGIHRVIRTINRWLALAVSHGFLRRNKRHRKTRRHGWEFRTSLYTITGPGWDLVIRNSKWTWNQFRSMLKEAKATFRKPKKTRKVERPSGSLTQIGEVINDLGFDTS